MAMESQEKMQMQMKGFFLGGRHAGVVTMVTNQEEESNVVEPTQPHGKKRKIPKQYRLAPPKLAKNREITAADKKKFKEMFLTDKSRFHKRQPTFNILNVALCELTLGDSIVLYSSLYSQCET